MVRISVTVIADEAASVSAALDALAPAPNRRAEGLVAMADAACRGSGAERSPTEVLFEINVDDLSGSTGDGAIVSAETSRRLLCDAGVVPALCDATGKTLDVGRKQRTIPAAIRRALTKRDRGCRFPGCENILVDGHHLEHWCDGGETQLDNLVSLCRRHHRLVHEGGAAIEASARGEWTFRNRTGAVLAAVPRRPAAEPLATNADDAWIANPTDHWRPIDWPSVTAAMLG